MDPKLLETEILDLDPVGQPFSFIRMLSTNLFKAVNCQWTLFNVYFFTSNKDWWTYKLLGTINDVVFLSKNDKGFLMTSPYVVQKVLVDFCSRGQKNHKFISSETLFVNLYIRSWKKSEVLFSELSVCQPKPSTNQIAGWNITNQNI